MRYLTATEAAKRIGVAEKTVRLWVKEGKLEALHPAKNRLAIAEEDVERLAQERQLYYSTQPALSSSIHTQADASVQVDLGILKQKVSRLEKRVAELEQEVRTHTQPDTPSHVTTEPPQPLQTLHTYITDREDVQPQQQPQKRNVEPNSTPLPYGTLRAIDFAREIGIDYTKLEGVMRHGMSRGRGQGKDYLEITELPSSREGYADKYFTPAQQERARELLRRHGKIE